MTSQHSTHISSGVPHRHQPSTAVPYNPPHFCLVCTAVIPAVCCHPTSFPTPCSPALHFTPSDTRYRPLQIPTVMPSPVAVVYHIIFLTQDRFSGPVPSRFLGVIPVVPVQFPDGSENCTCEREYAQQKLCCDSILHTRCFPGRVRKSSSLHLQGISQRQTL